MTLPVGWEHEKDVCHSTELMSDVFTKYSSSHLFYTVAMCTNFFAKTICMEE